MNRTALYAALLAVPITMPVLLIALLGGGGAAPPVDCAAGESAASALPTAPAAADTELDAEQMAVAQQVVAAVRAFPPTANKPKAAVIALATARQESGIRNLDYGDRDSLGVFQQRPSQGWGTPRQVTNVPHATRSFLRHLVLEPGWETRAVTDVAADVQRPAEEYRGLYAQWVPLATRVTEELWPSGEVSLIGTTRDETCDELMLTSGQEGVVYPVPPGLAGTDSHNWGGTGGLWSAWHTGTDFSVPCGTPVLAATGGTVEIDHGEAWAGPWLVKVVTGPTSLATWYAHMQAIEVVDGQRVVAGQRLGAAGDQGNASGCHLHFEVHLQNGAIYGPDNTDPSRWLAQHAARTGGALAG